MDLNYIIFFFKALGGSEDGTVIHGEIINNIRYADEYKIKLKNKKTQTANHRTSMNNFM